MNCTEWKGTVAERRPETARERFVDQDRVEMHRRLGDGNPVA